MLPDYKSRDRRPRLPARIWLFFGQTRASVPTLRDLIHLTKAPFSFEEGVSLLCRGRFFTSKKRPLCIQIAPFTPLSNRKENGVGHLFLILTGLLRSQPYASDALTYPYKPILAPMGISLHEHYLYTSASLS